MRRAVLIAACAVLLGACQTALSANRAVPGDTITVTPDYQWADRCIEGEPVEIRVLAAAEVPDLNEDNQAHLGMGEVVATGVAGDGGAFAVDIVAPDDLDRHAVWAECTAMLTVLDDEGQPVLDEDDQVVVAPQPWALIPDELVVHAPLVLTATPAEVEPGTTVMVSGPWCVSQVEDGETPVVEVTFLGETHTLETEEPQPFDEVWELVVTAPDEEGTYPVTATCAYDDGIPEDEQPGEEEPPLGPAAIVAEDYVPAEVVVAVQPTTTSTTVASTTTSTTAPPATAPRAVVAQPSYTG